MNLTKEMFEGTNPNYAVTIGTVQMAAVAAAQLAQATTVERHQAVLEHRQ